MVPVICGGCGLRGTVALAKLAAATNPQCPRCGSRDLDLADEIERTAELGEPTRKDCPKCGSNALMKVSRSDGSEVWNCAQCQYQSGSGPQSGERLLDKSSTRVATVDSGQTDHGFPWRVDTGDQEKGSHEVVVKAVGEDMPVTTGVFDTREKAERYLAEIKGHPNVERAGVQSFSAKRAFTDPPMDTLSDTDRVIEQVTCSNCLQSFNHQAGDPADPLPPCPNCGSMATSVAGGGMTRAAAGPTLNYGPDRRCTHAPRHNWERFPERDIDLGRAYRCSHCDMVRWAEGSKTSVLDAKAAELVDAIQATNPGMTRGAAQHLAYRTIERFPRIAGLPKAAVTPEDDRRRLDDDEVEDMPHAIDNLLHNRWHTPA